MTPPDPFRPVPNRVAALALAALLGACSLGRDGRAAQATQEAAATALRDAMTRAASAVQGTDLNASARWQSCPTGIGHRYSGGGVMRAPTTDPARQLSAIRAAVLAGGFRDRTQVDDHVTAERDDVTVDIRYRRPDRVWRFSVLTPCRTYGQQDQAQVKSSEEQVILRP